MVYAKDTELRKIRTAEFLYIVKLLNDSPSSDTGSWAELMRNVKSNGEYRFSAKDIEMVETKGASEDIAAEIFLGEWSTMGKERPTLELLMNLLVEVKLIKAANYVALLLGCDPPKRPDCRAQFDVLEMPENKIDAEVIEEQENDTDSSQISPSKAEALPLTAACHSYYGPKDIELKSIDTVQSPSSSSSSSSLSTHNDVNEPLQNDKHESSNSSLSLKATNTEATHKLSTINQTTLHYIPEIEYLDSSEVPAFFNANDSTTSESTTSDKSMSINSSNSDSNSGIPAILLQYNNK